MNGWSSRWTPALLFGALRAGILLLSSAAISAGVVACSIQGKSDVSLAFELSGSDVSLVRDFRFYIYDVELIDADGATHTVRFSPGPWQSERVALVDLIGTSDRDRNAIVRGELLSSDKAFSGVRFTVGVPFDLNHGNPLTAAAPLDRTDLFWAWQTGYKFLRADIDAAGHEWSFHLGSTGCSSASALRPPASPCAQPNRMRVELRGFDPLKRAVKIGIDDLMNATRDADRVCTGNYAHEPACRAAYALTGLAIETGSCQGDGCETQHLFRAP